MKKVTIAFDVDGTLRCNCTETCEDPNENIVALYNILFHMKNTKLYVWSGGGAAYAYRFAQKFGLPGGTCVGKMDVPQLKPDIAIDDQHGFSLGIFNLIVRER